MSQDLMVIRAPNGLVPATERDRENLSASYKMGQAVKVVTVKQSARSLQHHRLYFGGLLGLVKDYWEPQTGLTNPIEQRTVASFCAFLQSRGVSLTAAKALEAEYLHHLTQHRASRMITPIPATIDEIHEWVKVEAGYFDVIRLPDGSLHRKPRSTSFGRMCQEEFNVFFKAAFNVCWKFVLSQHFGSEDEAQNAINRMLEMAA